MQQLNTTSQSTCGNISFAVEPVTPDLAQIYLNTMIEGQRNLRPRKVAQYKADLLSGRWYLSEPIKFNQEGRLFDGQHRLRAVIAAGTPADFIVGRGYPIESMQVVDIGAVRSSKDIAKVAGYEISHAAFAIVNLLKNTAADGGWGTQILSHQERIDIYFKHEKAIEFCLKFSKVVGGIRHAAFYVAPVKAYYNYNHEKLARFLEIMNGGCVSPDECQAPRILRNWFLEKGISRSTHSTVRLDMYRKSISALSAFERNQNISRIYGTSQEVYKLPA